MLTKKGSFYMKILFFLESKILLNKQNLYGLCIKVKSKVSFTISWYLKKIFFTKCMLPFKTENATIITNIGK